MMPFLFSSSRRPAAHERFRRPTAVHLARLQHLTAQRRTRGRERGVCAHVHAEHPGVVVENRAFTWWKEINENGNVGRVAKCTE